MSDPIRLRCFMEYNYGHSVITINLEDWKRMVREDGEVTALEQAPDKLSAVMRDAEVVAIAASGTMNASPGIDIVRRDPKDAPNLYNTDHYTVVEQLSKHADYQSILDRARVVDSGELREILDEWVWIVGPEKDPEIHWSKEIPEHIRKAKRKPF